MSVKSMPKKRGLGRGLDSLLGAAPEAASPAPVSGDQVMQLYTAQLMPNPFQPRRRFSGESLDELAASILEKGILQPLVVRKSANPLGEIAFEIVAGERRWRAAQQIGFHEVPVIVREFNDQEMLELALIENLQREQLNPVEEAHAYQQLIHEFGLTQEQAAERVGKSRVSITNALRLLRLSEQILNWVEEDQLSAGHARALLGLDDEQMQLTLAREIITGRLSVRETEARVKQLLKVTSGRTQSKVLQEQDPHVKDYEDRLREHLGLRVRMIPGSSTAGKIEVHYSSLDEFQRFLDLIHLSFE